MNRIVAAVVAVFLSFSVFAQPACPTLQWSMGQASQGFEFGVFIQQNAAIDYDEDGKLDVVGVADFPQHRGLYWWKGNGNLTFAAPVLIADSFGFTNIVIADATGDGLDDVIVGDVSFQSIRILPATGSGRGPAIVSHINISPSGIFATNRDGDAAVELYVTSSSSQAVAVYDNIATTVTELAQLAVPGFAWGIVSADFDDDGHFDFAIGLNYPIQRMDVYFGNADETYDAPVSLPVDNPRELALGDLDEDGRPDFIAGNIKQDNTWPEGTISIYMNEGSRNFTHSTLFVDKPGQTGNIYSFLLQDVSGDGHLDLIASSGPHTTTAIGLGDGTFRSPTILTQIINTPYDPLHATSLGTGDFDGDDELDLVIGSHHYFYPFTSACSTQVDLLTISPVISAGNDATLHVEVSGFGSDTPAPRGTITLRDGATVLDTDPVDANGKVSFTLSGLALGDHPLTAEFSGNAALSAATSLVIVQTVTNETTETTITVPPGAKVYGETLAIQITIEDDGADWVWVNLDGQEFRHFSSTPLNVTLEPGLHTISARYLGTMYEPASEAGPVQFTIDKAASNIIGVGGTLSVRSGSAHVLSYNVTGGGPLQPGGTLQLIEGSTTIASGTLASGSVTLNATLTRGAHNVQVGYSGDTRYKASKQLIALEVLPNLPLAIEARGLAGGIHIAYVLPANTNTSTLQLLRRTPGGSWSPVGSWNAGTGMDPTILGKGVVYEYQLNASLNNGTPMSSPVDSALLFTDDPLFPLFGVKSKHFQEVRTAVNLLRVQAGLGAFSFSTAVNESALIRASHISELRTALTQARQQLGMTTPAFFGAGAGTQIRATHMQELRELAR
jgi:hypothetical protein